MSFWLENRGETYLYFSELNIDFDFGTYELENIRGGITPRRTQFLGNINFIFPMEVVGRRIFWLTYRVHDYMNDDWIDLGQYESDSRYVIGIYPKPFYTVFVSRGLRVQDRAVGDPTSEMIREWGFVTVTVGIEVKVREEEIPSQVKAEIKKSDGVIAIVTPRFLDALTSLWKTLEWSHDEIGIGFGIDKPLLIVKDKNVSFGGLPSYLAETKQAPMVEFDPSNLDGLRIGLSTIMPGFRGWIETRRKQEFFDGLSKFVVGGLVGGIVLGGITGVLSSSSRKES